MNSTHYIIILLLMSFTTITSAANQVPFGNQIKAVTNYNRATTQIATGGKLNEGGVQELAAQGFKTIIDLRTEAEGTLEEKQAVEAAGMRYINIPVTRDGINDEQLATFTNVIEQATTPVLLHCAQGNRVGAMWTAYRLSKGIAPYIAFEEGRTAGMQANLEEKIKASCRAKNLC
ncbi:protein tyrosine phosphatase family protein [Nitrosomonas sp. Is37]|uniref:protein tyrosine phosphatase family protein n=1 Tax=Nitrosomonas sp. Is37 TaxID=3080535 RepID=UPI00294AE65E|nr:protein tyrosine phosphatase family protein [Nitrosomonas sp. Is37]MDV6343982.1 protein tyrosine phosphatase family protein [Nitrosomonas sp. Is37]